MVTVPAFVWRGGTVRRAVLLGAGVGLCLGALAWLDSGLLLTGAIVTVVVGVFYGVWMSRRMLRYWPGSAELDGAQRVSVVGAARRGRRVEDPALAGPVADYARGLHAAAENGWPWRWLLVLVLAVAVATAAWDAAFGSWGNAIVSAIYLAALIVEVFWWPRRRARLLADADRAVAASRAEA